MKVDPLAEAIKWLEKANEDLEPELLDATWAQQRLADYARAEKLAAYGKTAVARKVDDAAKIAQVTGTSVGKAKQTVETAHALRNAEVVSQAFSSGSISLDQATEIARAEKAAPGCAGDLLSVASKESFHVLRDQARKRALEAQQSKGLAERQREAQTARHHIDELGMVDIHMKLPPLVGTQVVNRAEAEAGRLYRAAKREGRHEPYDRFLADAFGKMLLDTETKPGTRPETVVLVSLEVAERGWSEVRAGEICKIPGVGPIAPQEAKDIARRGFLNAVVCDGKDLREFKRWGRGFPIEVEVALELGTPPEFDGVKCVDCGNRFRNQRDHVEPVAAGGPTCTDNIDPRCYSCHKIKTKNDRKAGKLRRREGAVPSARPRTRVTVKRGPPLRC